VIDDESELRGIQPMDGHRRSNQDIDNPRPEIINSSITLRLILATMKRLCGIPSAQWFIIEMEP
jgi:hypothetical protein